MGRRNADADVDGHRDPESDADRLTQQAAAGNGCNPNGGFSVPVLDPTTHQPFAAGAPSGPKPAPEASSEQRTNPSPASASFQKRTLAGTSFTFCAWCSLLVILGIVAHGLLLSINWPGFRR